jgi:hypothetical protein
MTLLTAFALFGLAKAVLVAALAVLNALLAILASIAVWKTYLAVGLKVGIIALLFIPVIGILLFLIWGQRVVRENRA